MAEVLGETRLAESQNPGIVEVTWVDSLILNHGEWMDITDLRNNLGAADMLHKTVGYLVAESDDAVALCISINAQEGIPTSRVSGGMVIPKSAIKETTVLREKS